MRTWAVMAVMVGALQSAVAATPTPTPTATPTATATATPTATSNPTAPPRTPTTTRGRAADRELAAALDRIVAGTALAGARAGILVARVDSGEVVYAHDADALLNPASNVKLFTVAAALSRLGPEFRFETELWLEGGRGGLQTLHVRGKGDPTLVTERLWAIAGEVQHAGVRALRDVVVDESWFDGERDGPGYDQERGDRSYLAPTGAASLNFNTVAIHVAPGDRPGAKARIEVEPESDHLVVENRVTTGRAASRRKLRFSSALVDGRQRIRVEGRLPAGARPQVAWRKIDDPGAYLGETLRRLLQLRGVKVSGAVRKGPVPGGARLLHVAESEPLGETVRRLNKHSNNFTAEQILKALGAHEKGAPGSWPKGVAVAEEVLAEAGLAPGTYLLRNGSGLNDANRFSARQHVSLLRDMWRRFPLMADFVASLPVAGKDGTIRRRFGGAPFAGMIRAKTGTLEQVTSLAGYVETAAGERLAFAILVNDFPSRRGVVRAVDALAGALAAAGRPAELGEAVAAAPQPAAVEEPADALRAHVATYYQLAEAGDVRDAGALRAAIRAEDDPAVRMAAAEALYLADPSAEEGRRALLENLSLDPQSLSRLTAAGAGRVEAPVLGSLAELAAEGNAEAASRLVEAAPAAARDPAAASAYEPLLAEVAAEAGEPLLAALRAAPAPAADAAIAALARALAAREDVAGPHPFAALLARAGEGQGAPADAARAIAAKLAAGTATERALRHAPRKDAVGPATAR